MNADEIGVLKRIFRLINWEKLHEEIVLNPLGSGAYVWIHYSDDNVEFSLHSSGDFPGRDSDVVAMLKSPCLGDVEDAYFEGWGKYDYKNKWFLTDDGRKLTKEQAIIECIHDGHWCEYYRGLRNEIIEQFEARC